MKMPAAWCLAAALALLLSGCGETPADRAGTERSAADAWDAGARDDDDVAAADGKEAPRYADQDRDGRVTRAEAAADPALAASFDAFDENADGALDRGEFARLEAGADAPGERHTLRPRSEYPRPYE